MANRRSFVKKIAGSSVGIATGAHLLSGSLKQKESLLKSSNTAGIPDNPLILFDNFHRSNRMSYSWKSKFAAAKAAGFDGFEFVVVDPNSDNWKNAMDSFWEEEFDTWGFHWTTRAVVDKYAPGIDEEIEKIIKNIAHLAKLPTKPYFSLSLSGTDELKGANIAESGSAKAKDRHWQRAYKIIGAFDQACSDYEISGSLYPHVDWLCDTPQSAFNILEGAGAKYIGPAFCVHHWYANKASDDFDSVLKNEHMERLNYVVLTNGNFYPDKFNAVRFNEGQIDMAWILAKLYDFGYKGPISSQGWGIGGDPFVSIKQFVDTIHSLRKRFMDQPELNPLN